MRLLITYVCTRALITRRAGVGFCRTRMRTNGRGEEPLRATHLHEDRPSRSSDSDTSCSEEKLPQSPNTESIVVAGHIPPTDQHRRDAVGDGGSKFFADAN